MDFSSDTSAPAHPSVLEAIVAENSSNAPSYGGDRLTDELSSLIRSVFETNDLDIWLTASGTAANALALSCFCPPTGSVLCHEEAHIERDERGAPEFFSGGGKLKLLPGQNGQIDEMALRETLGAINRSFVHETPPSVLSLTNLTECGTAYRTDGVAHYAALAKDAGLAVHMDGARLANALAHLACSSADLTWRAGIDVLTLGLTKTGAMGCEIIILFGEARRARPDLLARAKRSGHMPPKLRYLAAQGHALLRDGLWLDLATRANRKARQLSNALCAFPGVRLAYPVEGNEVFAHLPPALLEALKSAGAIFYPWPGGSHRFVCAWSTPDHEIDAVSDCVRTVLASTKPE